MPVIVCPVCTTAYEGSDEFPRDPCGPCWNANWRTDSCGNVRRLITEADFEDDEEGLPCS